MINILLLAGCCVIFGAIGVGLICMMLGDTETFQAIDERIARLIKGADDE